MDLVYRFLRTPVATINGVNLRDGISDQRRRAILIAKARVGRLAIHISGHRGSIESPGPAV